MQEAKLAMENSKKMGTELMNLKKVVGKAEQYLGKKIEEVADSLEELGGDDYYADHKKEWNEEGITNKEKHDRIKSYRDLFANAEEVDDIDMINF